MLHIYKYIFCNAYYFCLKIFKEKEFPYFFASTIVSLTFVTTIITLLKTFQYIMIPNRINIYNDYHGYFSLLMLVVFGIYFYKDKKYERLLSEHDKIPKINRS